MTPKTERFEMRLDEEAFEKIDQWRAQQGDVPSRAEAIRRLVDLGLARTSGDAIKFSDGDRVVLMMMRDLYKHLKIAKGDIDPDFVGDVLSGGHSWALKWEMPGLYHGHEDNPADVRLVLDVLDLWDFLERGYERLPKKEKDRVGKEAAPFGESVRFHGFDGNNEAVHMSIAGFLVEKMNRFQRFKGRDLNSHMPSIGAYERMLRVFLPMRTVLAGGDLGAAQIIMILNAMRHPDARR